MSKNFVSPARPIERIHPALDFTEDTAFVGVGLPPATGNIFNSQTIVMTSKGRGIPWEIRTEYESRYKNIRLPKASHCEPARIRTGFIVGSWATGNLSGTVIRLIPTSRTWEPEKWTPIFLCCPSPP